MRIIAGKYKGRQIHASKDQSIRPTTNKIKEYVFDLIGEFVENATVLDIFCGSGSLGLEAVSRGAQNVTFIDNSQTSLRVLRRNVNQIKPEEPYRIIRRDALAFLKSNQQAFDLILADPPYTWDQFGKLLPLVFNGSNLSEFGMFVLESETANEVVWENEHYEVLRQKQFDRTLITFFTKKGTV